jgi:hypothetical protein
MNPFIQPIADALNRLGIDPAANLLPNSNGQGWGVPTDKSVLFLNLGEIDGQPSLRMTCPILFMPSQDLLPFYRKLLDLNSEMADIAFAMDRDTVCVVNQQALDGLNSLAIESLIRRMQKSVNVLADMLIQEFHNARFWSPI